MAHGNTHVSGTNCVINRHRTCVNSKHLKIIILHSNVFTQPYFWSRRYKMFLHQVLVIWFNFTHILWSVQNSVPLTVSLLLICNFSQYCMWCCLCHVYQKLSVQKRHIFRHFRHSYLNLDFTRVVVLCPIGVVLIWFTIIWMWRNSWQWWINCQRIWIHFCWNARCRPIIKHKSISYIYWLVEIGPDPTRAYFWPAVNKRPTCLWLGYFLTRREKNLKIWHF